MDQPSSGSTSPGTKRSGRASRPVGMLVLVCVPRTRPLEGSTLSGRPLGEEHAGGWVPCLWPSQAQLSSS